ncbi:MFS transporter [Asticcacaulis sp. SL142]|uniref:MFS transporter n=1 Tax=Asticcacaulis sp. SL142 TaxID=2995155 RepID=UPI00226CD28A|nr:MFS transporter [Asticcacaulis sp. SL142]WAC48912.1 MFS transporter [Asticcacaulis sp. SL142]
MSKSINPAQSHHVNMAQLLAFVGPCLPLAALGLPLAVILSEYYASEIGLSLGTVGLIFMSVRLVDIFVDPLVGWAMDKTRTRFGRFKVWMAICLPILFVSTGFIFLAPPGASPAYLWVWLLVIYIGFSIATLSQASWGSVLSPDYDERTKVFAWWQMANIVGIIAVLLIPVIVQSVLHGTYRQAVQYMGLFIMVLLPIMIGIALWRVPETQSDAPLHNVRISDYFRMLKRPNVIRVLLADLWLGLAPGIMGALFFFYFMQTKGLTREQCSISMFLYFVAGLVGAPLWTWASKKYNKHRTLIVSALIFAAVYALLAFLPAGNFPLAAFLVFLAGIPYAASLLLTRALMADIGDEVLAESGQDHKGALMSILSATTKLGYAFSVLTLSVLAALGFDNKAANNAPDALMWVQIFFIGLPVVFLLLGAWAMKSYDLTPERFAKIQAMLADKGLIRHAPSQPTGH